MFIIKARKSISTRDVIDIVLGNCGEPLVTYEGPDGESVMLGSFSLAHYSTDSLGSVLDAIEKGVKKAREEGGKCFVGSSCDFGNGGVYEPGQFVGYYNCDGRLVHGVFEGSDQLNHLDSIKETPEGTSGLIRELLEKGGCVEVWGNCASQYYTGNPPIPADGSGELQRAILAELESTPGAWHFHSSIWGGWKSGNGASAPILSATA
ncbi:MAG: hypothetical protein WCO84_05635 [bacterium]